MYPCVPPSPSTNLTLDVNTLTRYLISIGWLKPYNTRQTFKFIFANNGSGEYEFTGRLWKNRENRLGGYGGVVAREGYYVYQKVGNLTNVKTIEFGNLSMDWVGGTVAGAIYEFMWNYTAAGVNTTQSECAVMVGYNDTAWVTPKGQYLLPAPVSGRFIMPCTFTYS